MGLTAAQQAIVQEKIDTIEAGMQAVDDLTPDAPTPPPA